MRELDWLNNLSEEELDLVLKDEEVMGAILSLLHQRDPKPAPPRK